MLKTPVKRKKEHYVDNKEFLSAVIELRNYFLEGQHLGHENHIESVKYFLHHKDRRTSVRFRRYYEYLGGCFLKIATHLSYKPNFINYMYKDDMINDGIENCIQYVLNFNPEKSKNPFAYFTQIVYYAFLRRIAKEKRQLDIKDKIIEKSGFDDIASVDEGDTLGHSYHQIKSKIEMRMNY